uniref:RING-type domain-containing protein n=1 Tax=Chrysotila carterae TaxID=13221 RepID=A0A7S4FBP0_CHRCT
MLFMFQQGRDSHPGTEPYRQPPGALHGSVTPSEVEFNDFLFWRRPIPAVAEDGPEPWGSASAQTAEASYRGHQSAMRGSVNSGQRRNPSSDASAPAAALNWMGSADLQTLHGVDTEDQQETSASGVHISPSSSAAGGQPEEVFVYNRQANSVASASAAEFLTGRDGDRLLGILSAIRSLLGQESRFSQAAYVLQRDVQSFRERNHSGETSHIIGAESTMNNPDILDSVASMLQALQQIPDGPSGEPFISQQIDGSRSRPASTEAVQRLLQSSQHPRDSLASISDETCSICFEQFGCSPLLIMPCPYEHHFHRCCLLRWFAMSDTCPLCRERLE